MGREQGQIKESWRNLDCIFTYLYGKCLRLVINETVLACSPDFFFFFFDICPKYSGERDDVTRECGAGSRNSIDDF